MGPERYIVFLVLASLGGGVFIMSYLMDEESMERYGERIAEYNAEHHETMMDAALHRSKRRFPEAESGDKQVSMGDYKEQDTDIPDHPLSENDRVMRARANEGDVERVKRSNIGGSQGSEMSWDSHEGTDRGVEDLFVEAVKAKNMGQLTRDPVASNWQAGNRPDAALSQDSTVEDGFSKEENYDFVDFHPENVAAVEQDVHPLNVEAMNMLKNRHDVVFDLFESSEDEAGEDMPSTNDMLENPRDLGNDLSWESDVSESSDYAQPQETGINFYKIDNPIDLSKVLLESGDKKLVSFNRGIDFILKVMNGLFDLEGEDSVPLPSLNKTFGHGIMKGMFVASGGFFKNPATLSRTGDVAIVKNGDSVGLEVALGLKTLEAGYSHYDLKILKIHQNGTLDVSIAENSIKMKISLTYSPHCKVDVNYLELDKLGGIKVDITGLGAFQSMFNMLSKWLLDNFTNDFRNVVNKKLIEKAKKAVARQDICKYFPLDLL